ncbi:MAG: hypothetical protein ACKO11_16315 [Cuspidothrix sp.]
MNRNSVLAISRDYPIYLPIAIAENMSLLVSRKGLGLIIMKSANSTTIYSPIIAK